jgi:ribosomal protein S18 acetylase RimI-like enzyme
MRSQCLVPPVGLYCGFMDELTIRKATPGDTNRIADIIAREPGQEATGLTGSAELAREFGMALVRLPNSPQGWERTVVAELDGCVAGIIQAGDFPDFQVTPRLVYLAIRVFGPVKIMRLLPRLQARGRVQPKRPAGAYHIAEVDVDPSLRNRGIGSALLDYAEAEARRGGYALMSLTTTTINPARRLYERHGFRVVETKTGGTYEKYTGIEGRHLMVRDLK